MDEPMDSYDPGKFEEDLDNGIESNDDKDPLKGLEEVSEAESHDPEDLWESLEEMSEAESHDPEDLWESLEEISEDDYRRHKQELDEMKKQADNIKTEDDEDIFNIPTAVTSWGRNVYTKSSLTDYYEDQASGDEPRMGSFEDSSAMFDSFADQIGREKARVVSDVIRAWVNDEKPIGCDSTAPLWYNFAESYDNFNVPVDLEEVTIDSDDLDALRSFSEFTEQEFRDRYGDSLVLYRNVDKSGLEVMEKENSETGSMVLDHRPLESWTLDPEIAEDWQTGFILRKEVDVEDIIASQVTYPGFIPGEKEVIVGSEGREKYSEDEVVHTSEFDVEQNAE
jgi:thiol-disulfide isomerase/thioredoxin